MKELSGKDIVLVYGNCTECIFESFESCYDIAEFIYGVDCNGVSGDMCFKFKEVLEDCDYLNTKVGDHVKHKNLGEEYIVKFIFKNKNSMIVEDIKYGAEYIFEIAKFKKLL